MDPKARDCHDVPIRYGNEELERRRHVPKHAANPREAAKSVAALVAVAALILVAFVHWRESSAQIALTRAAREGARLDSLDEPNVVAFTQAATGLSPVTVTVTACAPGAGPTAKAVVNVSYSFKGFPVPITARGVMPCET